MTVFTLRECTPGDEAVTICPRCQTPLAAPTIGASFRGPADLWPHIAWMGGLDREELHVILANTKNGILGIERVYQGNLSASLVRVGELFREAIRRNAAGVVLVHNHPSGDPTPSPDDLHLTAEAIAAGRLLDIDVLDHIIVGRDAYQSLRDRGVSFDRPTTAPMLAAL